MGLILWGFWGYTSKLAANNIEWKQSTFFFALGVVLSTLILNIILMRSFSTALNKGSFYALASGTACLLGVAAVYIALEKEASLVIPFTALYPLITILLSAILLKEKITLMQGFGVILAIAAMILMSK
jgi:transporter family protein